MPLAHSFNRLIISSLGCSPVILSYEGACAGGCCASCRCDSHCAGLGTMQWARSAFTSDKAVKAFTSDKAVKVLHRLTHLLWRVGRWVWSRARQYDRSGKMVLNEEMSRSIGWPPAGRTTWVGCDASAPDRGSVLSWLSAAQKWCRTEASPWSACQHDVGWPRSSACY